MTYYCGYYNTIVPKTLPDLGYDAIAVALLGNSSPIGAIFAGGLISIFQTGSNYMSSSLGVAKEIASLITGIFAAVLSLRRLLPISGPPPSGSDGGRGRSAG